MHVHRVRVRHVELQWRDFLFDFADEPEFFVLVLIQKTGDGFDIGHRRQFFEFLFSAIASGSESATTAP